ncbi:DUF6308 family protein [Streptomyces sp. NPDC056721]|uniref:DUF6308 family protein n=1 Tax=unclassified Streptomyces TaxID=2593676 RepID=UPI003669F67B
MTTGERGHASPMTADRPARRSPTVTGALEDPLSTDSWPFLERLRRVIRAEQAGEDLRRYFGIGGPSATASFTGRRFEHLAGGGDRPAFADAVTADDLIAMQTLSVTVPATTALELLEGELGGQLSELLRQVPNGRDMVEVDASDLAPGSAADAAWHLLRSRRGIGWVTAGKLLARKRPRLIPVYDQVVKCVVGSPRSFWLDLHAAVLADGCALHEELVALRRSAEVPETVSVLRVCDVALWMRHHGQHRKTDCGGLERAAGASRGQ